MQKARAVSKKSKRHARTSKIRAPVVTIPKDYVLVSRRWLAKLLEDQYDIAAIRKGRREKTISWEEVECQLRKDGRL